MTQQQKASPNMPTSNLHDTPAADPPSPRHYDWPRIRKAWRFLAGGGGTGVNPLETVATHFVNCLNTCS